MLLMMAFEQDLTILFFANIVMNIIMIIIILNMIILNILIAMPLLCTCLQMVSQFYN